MVSQLKYTQKEIINVDRQAKINYLCLIQLIFMITTQIVFDSLYTDNHYTASLHKL